MLELGTLLRNDTYKIVGHIANGGFGNTYKVLNTAFDEILAMKEFFVRGINAREGKDVTVSLPENNATFESLRNKFRQEAQRLRHLNNEHIVRVHDLFEENGTVYYVMDYIDGQSIGAQLKNQPNPMTENEALVILPQVLDALKTIHAQNIWHLDIKPGNLMIDGCQHVSLIDFGASKQMRPNGELSSSSMCYTPGYAPMEQVEQNVEKFGPWTDFYALGATLYYMLTKQTPPSSSDLADGDDFQFPSSVSEDMQKLIRWLMSPQRNSRPQSVAEIEQRISLMLSPPKTSARTVLHKSRRKSPHLLILLVSLLLVAALGLGAYFLFGYKSGKASLVDDEEEEDVEMVREIHLEGAIGQYPVKMDLEVNGTVVSGNYYYESQGPNKRLILNGTYSRGRVVLTEFTVDGAPTGQFQGKLTRNVFKGNFTSSRGQTLTFNLKKK